MKRIAFAAIVLLLSVCAPATSSSQMGQSAMPPGARNGGVFPATNAPLETYKPDPTELRREADELAALAAGLPSQVGAVNSGMLPKDLGTNLKRIEKIAKHLRSEIVR
jgi:hypothetical protein